MRVCVCVCVRVCVCVCACACVCVVGWGVLTSLFNTWGALRRARSALVENWGELIHAVQISSVFAWNSKHRGGLNPLAPTPALGPCAQSPFVWTQLPADGGFNLFTLHSSGLTAELRNLTFCVRGTQPWCKGWGGW